MSAKWRALQHRHQWTYGAVVFPQSYLESLQLLPPDASSSKFFVELRELTSLNSMYSQISGAKKVASAFAALITNGGNHIVLALRFYLEILFLENSLPLHRTLIAVLTKNQSVAEYRGAIEDCFSCLCEEYGVEGRKGKKFSLCRVALTLINFPKIGFLIGTVEKCLIPIAFDISRGLESVLTGISEGSRPSPITMEQCQEAMSCLYYLIQRFPTKFAESGVGKRSGNCLGFEDSSIFEIVVASILDVLKSSAFSRDCFVAAGVSFCAALQACLNPRKLACFITDGFFARQGYKYTVLATDEDLDGNNKSDLLDSNPKVLFCGNFNSIIGSFSVLSRICVLRGVLTAIPRTILNMHFIVSACGFDLPSEVRTIWTILVDGILPELCNYCENPIDSHFNFHALTVTQICLQQIKTSLLANLVHPSETVLREAQKIHGLAEEYFYEPFPEGISSRLLRIIWNNLEDPLSQTVKQVHLIFDLFLDIQSMVFNSGEKTKSLLCKIALDLLRLGGRCKGRYVPLASLTKRLGAKTILAMNPDLLFQTMQAYVDDDVCCSVTLFLKCFLECLRDECWSSDGVEQGYVVFRGLCLPPIMHGLVSGLSKLRSNLNTYALPAVLEVDVDSIFPMLSFISSSQIVGESEFEMDFPEIAATLPTSLTVDQRVASLVSLLKVSRSLALIEGDIDWHYNPSSSQQKNGLCNQDLKRFALVYVKGIEVKVLVKWLVFALTHVDDTLRIDAAETLFLNPKTSSLPSPLELSLMKESVPLNMRCCSTAFQMKWSSLFRKFFSRVRTALDRQVKQGSCNSESQAMAKSTLVDPRAIDLFRFMKWLSCFLFFSCYPSAPYERKTMAMELLLIMINVWPVSPITHSLSSPLYPYSQGFTSPDSTLLLVGSIIDSWDRLRESSFRILLHFPNPLPGISDEVAIKELITWAKRLVCSSRVRESDAGALTFRLIFRKYVLELGWIINASVIVTCCKDGPTSKSKNALMEYIMSLVDWLCVVVEEGEKDLSKACENSFVHGVLLTLRYTFEELDWSSELVLASGFEMRVALEKLLELVMRITSLALWVVAADAWYLPEGMDDMVDDDMFLSNAPDEMDAVRLSLEPESKDSNLIESVRPTEQVVMVGCWLAMKEVSLLLGSITRKVPLPVCTSNLSDIGNCIVMAPDKQMTTMHDTMLDLKQLETIGNHFLQVLLKMKHNGAIDKTRAGFTALCNRLLCSNDPRLCRMTESWMDQLMERTVAKGQTVDDLLRRSAGIPAAFIAFFLSEPEGTPKKLLPRALRWLIDVAKMSLPIQNGDFMCKKASLSTLAVEMDGNGRVSKIRDEGVIPTVHAFNVLRAAFNDTNLATDTSGFCAEALIISIRSFSSPYWEIRNSACLAYTALVRRMIGFLNVQKRESARRALSGLEFFHRYPTLHPFLFDELKSAIGLLGDVSSQNPGASIEKNVHPSLCPVLILLSRLKPSMISSEAQDPLDPFSFMPLIKRCGTQSNQRVRVLASRALTGLVSNEKLQTTLRIIASGLPPERNKTAIPEANSSISSGCVNGKPHFASFNCIHGILLQLGSLIDINCQNLTDSSRKDQILSELIPVLAQCSWIGSVKACPCPTLNGAYLQVLGRMLSIARMCMTSEHIITIRSLLLKLSSECLDSNHGSEFYDPTKLELCRQATAFYFDCVFGGSPEATKENFLAKNYSGSLATPPTTGNIDRFQERLMSCISNVSYEVRLSTLKWLLGFLKSTESRNDFGSFDLWAKINMQQTLFQLLGVERNPKCAYYILRILFFWNLAQFPKPNETINVGVMDYDSVFEFWDKLISLQEVVRYTKTREILICCMAICIKRFTRFFCEVRTDSNKLNVSDKWIKIYGHINIFVIQIKQNGASSEPVNMRRAAAEAMIASGLLEEAVSVCSLVSNKQIISEESCICEHEKESSDCKQSEIVNLYARDILELWFMCIKLLEDEDLGIRQKLAMDVQRCISTTGSARSIWDSIVPTQVEKVIASSFEFLSSIFSHWLEYFDYLLRWVFDSTSSVITGRDLVRRVFDKEIDNHHEERLLICQICCFHIEKLLTMKSWAVGSTDKCCREQHLSSCRGVGSFLYNWRMKFLCQIKCLARNYLQTEDGLYWIGGISNHKDAFISLYSNLLGLYAFSRCPIDDCCPSTISLSTDLVELDEVVGPFLRNPLILNLYSLVLQEYEKTFGVTINHKNRPKHGDCSDREDFDPYFLLR